MDKHALRPRDDAESIAFRLHSETCPYCSTREDVLDLCHEGSRLLREMFAADEESDAP